MVLVEIVQFDVRKIRIYPVWGSEMGPSPTRPDACLSSPPAGTSDTLLFPLTPPPFGKEGGREGVWGAGQLTDVVPLKFVNA